MPHKKEVNCEKVDVQMRGMMINERREGNDNDL
jgi:hypothetical protein